MRQLIHVGCGPKRKDQTIPAFRSDDWQEVRLDIDESVQPDIVGSMTDMSGVETGSMDALFSSHNVEHLYPHEVPVAFREFHRVLGEDGFAVITCPDLQSVCEMVADDKLLETAYTSPAGPITPLDILFGHRASIARGKHYMAHHVGFTRKLLVGEIRRAGFASVAAVRRRKSFDLWVYAKKRETPEDELRTEAAGFLPA